MAKKKKKAKTGTKKKTPAKKRAAKKNDPTESCIVDTAGDGAFAVVPDAQAGAEVLIDVLSAVNSQNVDHQPAHRMHLRCGLHYGQVLTNDEVVTGDAVNLAARLEALNKEYGSRLLISESTAALAEDPDLEQVGESVARGQSHTTRLYSLDRYLLKSTKDSNT